MAESRWAHWSRGLTEQKKGMSSFLKEAQKVVPGDPHQKGIEMGLTPEKWGWWIDDNGQTKARTINGQLVVFDEDPRKGATGEQPLNTGNPSGASGLSPADRARSLGLQSNGSGGYTDGAGNIVARTVNNELVFYDDGMSGGAVTDGGGGMQLAMAQPSWVDPQTGLIMVPPAAPETPNEIAAVPDPTPATPPLGFNDFIDKKRKEAYRKADLEAEVQMDMDQRMENLKQQPELMELYDMLTEDEDTINTKLENGQMEQARHEFLTNKINTIKDQIEKASAKVASDTEGMDDQYASKATQEQAIIIDSEWALGDIDDDFQKLQASREFQAAGPEEKQRMLDEFETENKPTVRELEDLIRRAKFRYGKNLQDGRRAHEKKELQKVMVNPDYDMTQTGTKIGSGRFGSIDVIGDGNIIKTGEINMKEARILGKLHGTGVAPKLINYSPAGPDQDKDKMAMSLVSGSPLEKIVETLDDDAKEELAFEFYKKISRIHLKGIAHNDLHNENIIVSDDMEVSFIDFGLAEESYGRALMEAINPSHWVVQDEYYDPLMQQGLSVDFSKFGQRHAFASGKAEAVLDEWRIENMNKGIEHFPDIQRIMQGGYGFIDEPERLTTQYDIDENQAPMPVEMFNLNTIPEEVYKKALEAFYNELL
jgi:serine/threonine protein kinase